MKIEIVKITDIRPYERNAKKHPKSQIEAIARSIKAFGWNVPVVLDKRGNLVAGHGRLLAAQELGQTEVPAIRNSDLSAAQVKAYRLADNKLTESDWDMELVIEELKELSAEGFNIDLTGFDEDLILETKEDDAALAGAMGGSRVKRGEIWELGEHRLMCGDATSTDDMKALMQGKPARMIFTDPPYGIAFESAAGETIENDDLDAKSLESFFVKALVLAAKHTTADATLYWWMAEKYSDVNRAAWKAAGWHWSQNVYWLKNGPGWIPSQLYQPIIEPCMVGWKKKGSPHYQDLGFSKFTQLWTLDKKKFADRLDAWYENKDPNKDHIHPTQKPVRLAERALKRSSEASDIVLDIFGGSGSTLIACEELGRRARVMELDPKYAERIIARWEALTKKEAKKCKSSAGKNG